MKQVKNGIGSQIKVALRNVCESHKLSLAQVWVPYDNKKWALKLSGHFGDSVEDCMIFKEYLDACDTVPLKFGEELVGKTLQDYKPRLCDTFFKLGRSNERMVWSGRDLGQRTKWRSFTICLIREPDEEYAFEFIWRNQSDSAKVLQELLITLKHNLPDSNFKYPSGYELGDELEIEETRYFKIFKGIRSSLRQVNGNGNLLFQITTSFYVIIFYFIFIYQTF